jgi:hypothetical protein
MAKTEIDLRKQQAIKRLIQLQAEQAVKDQDHHRRG